MGLMAAGHLNSKPSNMAIEVQEALKQLVIDYLGILQPYMYIRSTAKTISQGSQNEIKRLSWGPDFGGRG